jgi:hypothetical protein
VARYFFDFSDEAETYTDTEGTQLDNDAEAELEAARALIDVVRERFSRAGAPLNSVTLRNENGVTLCLITLRFEIERPTS